ncbi:hypothetical protein M378DRAFT_161851 [Amanita muscaria Koide BX008]|uniref:Zn(2)-C6 fungal-type domain-containing protein n=1 Tax=Amanita muscaria (strain Koide BX008) TaxID=946122 RepID=A0A0C2WUW9_AMAMK|nr:hypothetical protein M378DRAFT_161851 [Amanita muscaria Koide BX008]
MSTSPYEKRNDLVKKRRKGSTRLSCAECRRLKLRCDRGIPCSSCVKRGCSAICPDGSLTTGQGNRFVLASTQELHEKIAELAQRVRDLEDALRVTHCQMSSEPHPLLSEELLKVKAPLQRDPPATRYAGQKAEETGTEIIDAFGSLSISVSGQTTYYGSIANSWYFLQNEIKETQEPEDSQETDPSLQNFLPAHILAKAAAFPISSVPDSCAQKSSLNALFRYLPSIGKANELRSMYFERAAWMYNPISPQSFNNDIFGHFYDVNACPLSDDPISCHRLSVMFMVLAIGSLMDTNLPAYNTNAEVYHQLAKAALFHDSFIDNPTLTAVQALFLMTFYLFFADRNSKNNGARWTIMGMAVKIAQSIGLHRDSGRWKIDPEETQRRRELFWELFTYDSWQCLTFGRPPSFALPHVDCKMPFENDATSDQMFHAWKHRFTSECMNLLHDQAFGAKMPSYATVIQLDRKLRAFPVPPLLQMNYYAHSPNASGGDSPMLILQRHIILAIRDATLLYLHRSFFARAISDHPKDPLGSPYGASVLAAYRSAGTLVALMRNLHNQLEELSERIWFLWTHMFSCAIVLGSIVTRCPSIGIAPSALAQLNSACELFSKSARGFNASQVLTIMQHLQQKAHLTMEEYERQRDSPASPFTKSIIPANDNDELSILGGKTRLVGKREPLSPILDRSPNSHNPVVPLPLPSNASNFDPNVWEYLSSFSQEEQNGQQHLQMLPEQKGIGRNMYTDPEPLSAFGAGPSTDVHYIPNNDSQMRVVSSSQGVERSQVQRIQGPSATTIPPYFPVYDYGTSVMSGGHQQPMALTSNGNASQSSGSPTMHTMWQDFVHHVAM